MFNIIFVVSNDELLLHGKTFCYVSCNNKTGRYIIGSNFIDTAAWKNINFFLW